MSTTFFSIESHWRGGSLTAAEIGRGILPMLEQLAPLDPAMSNWLLLDTRRSKWVALSDGAPDMTGLVERNVARGDFSGKPEPVLGYHLVLKGSKVASDFGASDSINISLNLGSRSLSDLRFGVGDSGLPPPDLSLVTHATYKGALTAMASVWPCPWALAYTYTPEEREFTPLDTIPPIDELIKRAGQPRWPFQVAWLAYLSAPLAKGLSPPPEITWEPTPGGGMMLSAVPERLDQGNADHMRRSRMLEAIMTERVGVEYRSKYDAGGRAPDLPARVGIY